MVVVIGESVEGVMRTCRMEWVLRRGRQVVAGGFESG